MQTDSTFMRTNTRTAFKLTLLFSLLFTFGLSAQKNSKIWDALLSNNREQALTLVEKINTSKSIENALTRAIVKEENGLLIREENFLNQATSYDDFENYLYAFWNDSFFFWDYLETGFYADNISAGKAIPLDIINNTTVKSGLQYYKAVLARYEKDWTGYKSSLQAINALKDWEYCGVFENINNSGMEAVYEPEYISDLGKLFDTQGNGKVGWYENPNNTQAKEAYGFFMNHREFGSGVNYAQTFVVSDTQQPVHLKVGYGGLLKVFVNDVLVVDNDKDVITELDAVTYEVTLNKGSNRILIKSATELQTPYFIVRLEDGNGNIPSGISTDLKKRDYKKGSDNTVNPISKPHSVIAYFEELYAQDKDNFFNAYCLINSYLRNSNTEQALPIINTWLAKYPKSSLLAYYKLGCYNLIDATTQAEEIAKNVEKNDPNYYVAALASMEDFDKVMALDMDKFNKRLDDLSSAVDLPYMSTVMNMLKAFRMQDLDAVKKELEVISNDTYLPSSIKSTFVQLFAQVLSDKDRTIAELQKINKEYYLFETIALESSYYWNQNKIDESLAVYAEALEQFPSDNTLLRKYVSMLQSNKRYAASIPYIEKANENYPYNYMFKEYMGEALQQTGKTKEAIAYYEEVIDRNAGTSALRKLLRDLKGEEDPLEQFKNTDLYGFIEKERAKIKNNTYGINILLDQIDVLQYKEGGGRYQASIIYEVTSQQGINSLKEYNLGLYGDYTIFKSEIVRQDGSVVPAECSGSNCVFNGLGIGDVILLDYTKSFKSSGRFYKDFVDSKGFSSYHPINTKVYRILVEKSGTPPKYQVANGSLEPKTYNKGKYKVYEWSAKDKDPIAPYEDYMPEFVDVAQELQLSTINSWSEIADWYSDLVRNQIEFDETVKAAFQEIFPDGHSQLSENERAKRIYNYITESFSYSYVSFKQSGFVPQKPSKVITTKLGDCKDFSTLFVTLAQKADLDANLVLILTSDNGEKALFMPSTDFNHCIVNVEIDQKQQYLELTSKYLPFKSLPTSLINATALEIPYVKGQMQNNDIKILKNLDRKEAVFAVKSKVVVGEEKSTVENEITTTGSLSTAYIEMFEDSTTKESLFKNISETITGLSNKNILVKEVVNTSSSRETDVASFKTRLELNEKPNRIGTLQTFSIPYFANPYDQSIIKLEDREYPINYIKYENADVYEEEILISIPDGLAFVEVPESKKFNFKKHSYDLVYSNVAEGLLVTVKATTPLEDISPEEYPEFKTYVQNVLESRRQLIGFK